ncbi:MAG: hypothetical protein IJE04_05440 [Bacilli bacterium]|nr:hypothetical protein [Bacilli bacterium]
MENNLEILENIMKPYFDKKAEIENIPVKLENEKNETANKIRELKVERISKRKELELELENLKVRREIALNDFKEKMERDIEAYIGNAQNSNSNFFASYGSMLRKDLEREYNIKLKELEGNFKDQEQSLAVEISKLKIVTDEEISNKQDLEDLGKGLDYSRVDLREMVEIKGNLRKSLMAEQKRLNFELKQQQINFDSAMLRLDSFKYEYNDQQQVINGADWRAIYEESNGIADRMDEIRKALKKVEEYLKITELTKEETAAVMMSMTHWEKAEYDRRKGNASNITEDENKKDDSTKTDEDIVQIDDPVVSNFEEKNGNIAVDDMQNLLKTIYNEIVKEAMSLNSVKISESKSKDNLYISSKSGDGEYKENGMLGESIKLPCGEYINSDDISQAINNLYNKTKDKKYITKETGKEYKISEETIKKLKRKFKKCSTLKLVKEKKVSKLDLLKVFGKTKANKVMTEVEMSTLKEVNVKEGDYINRDDLIISLNNLFINKELDWLRNFSNTLKDKKDILVNYFKNKKTSEELELEETTITKK